MQRLRYETGEKKRRIWPLRKLVRQFYQSGLLDLMPVWLTSPETLSSIFPLKEGLFDLVIFDEASQCPVENGLPSIYRGKQIIVAGDEKQLPPSTHFRGMLSAEEDEEEAENGLEESESLLNLAKRIYPARMLEWHYRSASQELIHFSNHAFYHGRMEIAPNVRPYQHPPAIQWRKVNGLWINRRNEREAREVIEVLKEQLRTHPEETVGIITFNADQRDLIEEMIDRRAEEDPEFSVLYEEAQKQAPDRRVFVKISRTSRGTSGTSSFFPSGTARNEEENPPPVRFPEQAGGETGSTWRSPGRRKIVVAASIEPHELDVANTAHKGPKLLRHYLEYARAVSTWTGTWVEASSGGLTSITTGRQERADRFDSPFEQQVCDALEKVGIQSGHPGGRLLPDRLAVFTPSDPGTVHSGDRVRRSDVSQFRTPGSGCVPAGISRIQGMDDPSHLEPQLVAESRPGVGADRASDPGTGGEGREKGSRIDGPGLMGSFLAE